MSSGTTTRNTFNAGGQSNGVDSALTWWLCSIHGAAHLQKPVKCWTVAPRDSAPNGFVVNAP